MRHTDQDQPTQTPPEGHTHPQKQTHTHTHTQREPRARTHTQTPGKGHEVTPHNPTWGGPTVLPDVNVAAAPHTTRQLVAEHCSGTFLRLPAGVEWNGFEQDKHPLDVRQRLREQRTEQWDRMQCTRGRHVKVAVTVRQPPHPRGSSKERGTCTPTKQREGRHAQEAQKNINFMVLDASSRGRGAMQWRAQGTERGASTHCTLSKGARGQAPQQTALSQRTVTGYCTKKKLTLYKVKSLFKEQVTSPLQQRTRPSLCHVRSGRGPTGHGAAGEASRGAVCPRRGRGGDDEQRALLRKETKRSRRQEGAFRTHMPHKTRRCVGVGIVLTVVVGGGARGRGQIEGR